MLSLPRLQKDLDSYAKVESHSGCCASGCAASELYDELTDLINQYDANAYAVLGVPNLKAMFQVNETVAAPQRFPTVGVDAAGRFSVAWQTINQDGSSWAVFQREYRSDDTPDTGEQIVNTVTSGPQIEPVFARSILGNYDLFWSGTMADHVDGIGGRAFGINTVSTGPNMNGPGSPAGGPERRPIAIPLTIASADADVAVTLSVVITGVPADATLSAGRCSRTEAGCCP